MKMAKCIVELERIYKIRNGSANPEGTQVGREVQNAPDQRSLGEIMGISVDQLKRYKKLLGLTPDIQNMVELEWIYGIAHGGDRKSTQQNVVLKT